MLILGYIFKVVLEGHGERHEGNQWSDSCHLNGEVLKFRQRFFSKREYDNIFSVDPEN